MIEDVNIFFLLNAVALGIASVASLAFLYFTIHEANRTNGWRVLILTTTAIACWVTMSFIELFYRTEFWSYAITVFGVIMIVGLLMMSLTAPNVKITLVHWVVFSTVVPLGVAMAIPGVVYDAIVKTPDGYNQIIPGPYFAIHHGTLVLYVFIAICMYIYRYRNADGTVLRVLLRTLGIGTGIFFIVGTITIVLLPAYGYSEFGNLGTAFVLVYMMYAFTYAYIAYGRNLSKERPLIT